MKVQKGDEVKDRVSGFKGVAVAQHSYLQGCDRFSVQPRVNKDGTLPDDRSFDEPDLIVIKAQKVVGSGDKTNGGPERHMPKAKSTG